MRSKSFAMIMSAAIAASLCAGAWGQSKVIDSASERIEQGLKKFEKSDFPSALSVFQGVLLDPSAKKRHPDAAYWSALSYVGLKDYDNADRTMGLFLTSYPSSSLYPDALYQQGRISYLRQEHDRSLKIFQNFLETYPDSDLYASALFWAGECMYQLGKLKQAESVFLAIVKEYPEGVKTEAANYRLGLIDLKYREEELLKLLKWSHEESLRIIEEYQGREKTYEQALNAYQRQIAVLKGGKPAPTESDKAGELESQTAALKSSSEKSASEAEALKFLLVKAEAERNEALAALSDLEKAQKAASSSESFSPKGIQELLDIKAKALQLKEFYLEWLLANAPGGAPK
jgi:TolA-binding protein